MVCLLSYFSGLDHCHLPNGANAIEPLKHEEIGKNVKIVFLSKSCLVLVFYLHSQQRQTSWEGCLEPGNRTKLGKYCCPCWNRVISSGLEGLFICILSMSWALGALPDVLISTEKHLRWLLPFIIQCQLVGRRVMLRQTLLTVSSGSGWKRMEFPWISGEHFIKNLSCWKLSVMESFEELSFLPPQNNIL